MRVQTIFQTLALATSVLAAPVARPELSLPGGLPTGDVTSLTNKLPLDSVKGLTSKLPVDTDTITGAVPVNTDAITSALPVDIVRRQLDDIMEQVKSIEAKLPVKTDTLTGALPVKPETITGALPVDVARRQLDSLLSPVTETLTSLISQFSKASSTLTGAATKLNGMLPANVDNGDAILDSLVATMKTVKPEVDSAIDNFQSGDVQGLLNQATAAGASDTAKKVNASLGAMSLALNQMLADSDSVSHLGLQGYAAKISALQGPLYAMIDKVKSASGTNLPL